MTTTLKAVIVSLIFIAVIVLIALAIRAIIKILWVPLVAIFAYLLIKACIDCYKDTHKKDAK